MTAISAVRAICSPNVGPIELAEKSAWLHAELLVERGAHARDLVRLERLGRDLEDVLAEVRLLDLLDLGVLEVARQRVAHVLRARRLLDRRLDPRARLEVDAEVDAPCRRSRSAPISRITPDIEKNHFDLPMKSNVHGRPSPCAPSAKREFRSACPAERAHQRGREEHGGEHRRERADAEREREALDAGGREHEEDERDADDHHVRVDDRAQRLRVAGGDGRRDRAPGAHLFLDAFEDDDVRVGRDAQREDQARDARQRQRDRDQLDQREQQHRVDEQRDAREPAEHAVEEEQEEQRQRQADGARDQALVQRLLTERRRDLRLRDQLQVDRQRADAQALGEVLRVLQVADAVDLRARAAVDALRVLEVVDRRQRDDLVVERDREALERGLRGPPRSA